MPPSLVVEKLTVDDVDVRLNSEEGSAEYQQLGYEDEYAGVYAPLRRYYETPDGKYHGGYP